MPPVALLGFLPWVDASRGTDVRENPAALAAERAARSLQVAGIPALFVPVPVSGEGIIAALAGVRSMGATVAVALGQTRTEPRVERYGRVPLPTLPAAPDEHTPWLLAPDADALAAELDALRLAASGTLPVRASDDAGAYFCDHLCVELAREAARRPFTARFLHVTAIDGCPPDVREARLTEYERQAVHLAHVLLRASSPRS